MATLGHLFSTQQRNFGLTSDCLVFAWLLSALLCLLPTQAVAADALTAVSTTQLSTLNISSFVQVANPAKIICKDCDHHLADTLSNNPDLEDKQLPAYHPTPPKRSARTQYHGGLALQLPDTIVAAQARDPPDSNSSRL